MKIYLCRHGQTTGDIEDRFGGNYDDHLTAEGQQQAQTLAEKLATKGIQIMYVSPLLRAKETAEVVQNNCNCVVEFMEDFRERNSYGILTGLVKAEAQQKYPDQFELTKDPHNNLEGAEKYEDFCVRLNRAFAEIYNSGFDTVAIVTHGGPIRVFFREIQKLGEIKIADCAFALLEKTPDSLKVIELDGIQLEAK